MSVLINDKADEMDLLLAEGDLLLAEMEAWLEQGDVDPDRLLNRLSSLKQHGQQLENAKTEIARQVANQARGQQMMTGYARSMELLEREERGVQANEI